MLHAPIDFCAHEIMCNNNFHLRNCSLKILQNYILGPFFFVSTITLKVALATHKITLHTNKKT